MEGDAHTSPDSVFTYGGAHTQGWFASSLAAGGEAIFRRG